MTLNQSLKPFVEDNRICQVESENLIITNGQETYTDATKSQKNIQNTYSDIARTQKTDKRLTLTSRNCRAKERDIHADQENRRMTKKGNE